ncbi:MAG: transposase [Eubacteriales bacterium]
MPRTARAKSASSIYHVMLRGINRQQIFFDEEDNRYFLRLLDRFKKPCGYTLHAYCLMGNHVHLLIEEGKTEEALPIGECFKRIGSSFVYWYNLKYERVGHLFQDRFRSEPVNDDLYYRTVFRYILQNPVKAGYCDYPEQYIYSSAAEYLFSRKGITDTEFTRSLFGSSSVAGFIHEQNDDECLEMNENTVIRRTDSAAKGMILKAFGTYTPAVGKAQERQTFNHAVCRLLDQGVSIRQLSRLTGIPKKVIEEARKREDKQ